jgi:hypothetical protein
MNLLEQSYHQLVLYFTYKSTCTEPTVKWDLDFHQLKVEPLEVVVLYFVKLPTTIILPSACWAVAYTILLVNPEPALKVASRIHHYLSLIILPASIPLKEVKEPAIIIFHQAVLKNNTLYHWDHSLS